MPLNRRDVTDSRGSDEIYLIGSGVSFDDAEDSGYENSLSSAGHLSSPPDSARSPSEQQTLRSPSGSDRAYAELLVGYRRQQQELARLHAANEERTRDMERLGADLLSMTHRYLRAQAAADALEAKLKGAGETHEALAQDCKRAMIENRALRMRCEELERKQEQHEKRQKVERDEEKESEQAQDRIDSATCASTISSEYVAVEKPLPPAAQPEVSPEELVGLVRTINIQSLEIARACISSATFRAGVRVLQVDNKMIVDVTEGIGCVLVQFLRAKDHSKDTTVVELGLQTLLTYHVSKIVENWPFHMQLEDDKDSQGSSKDKQKDESAKGGFSRAIESALVDIVTVLSLCGSPGHVSSLKRSHQERVGSTIDALFKSAEKLASHTKGVSGVPSATEYKVLYARVGSTFNKDFMQKQGSQGPQPAIAKWKSASKKPAQVLCTREVGLARLHRIGSSTSSLLSRTTSQSSRASGSSKELEVLIKATVVFESEVDK